MSCQIVSTPNVLDKPPKHPLLCFFHLNSTFLGGGGNSLLKQDRLCIPSFLFSGDLLSYPL